MPKRKRNVAREMFNELEDLMNPSRADIQFEPDDWFGFWKKKGAFKKR